MFAGCLIASCAGTASTATPSPASPVPSVTVATSVPSVASATPTAVASPRLELPLVLLDVRAGTGVSQPGTIPPGPGGSLTIGPETHAVDEAGAVWLYDQAKSRVVAYDKGRFVRAVSVPDVPRRASALLVAGGRIYFRTFEGSGAATELELDGITGKLLRRSGAPSLYPYERTQLPYVPSTAKGVDDVLGLDALGNRYERHYFAQWSAGQCFSVIRRIAPSGQDLAEACFDVGSYATDYFVARDGAVYQLEQLYSGSRLDRFAVTRVMSPAK